MHGRDEVLKGANGKENPLVCQMHFQLRSVDDDLNPIPTLIMMTGGPRFCRVKRETTAAR